MPNVDYPGALPMFVDRQRVFIDQNDHTWLCLHKTASGGTAQDIAHFFANDPAMASSHYVIGQDGTIVQVVQEVDGSGANCCLETGHAAFLPLGVNLNVKTISVEHVDPASDNSTPLSDAQKAASFKLVHDICQRHNIPMRAGDASGGIIGHNQIAPLSRARCPGNYPMDELFAYLEGGGIVIPTGWHDDGQTLTAPNGHKVVQGFREFVLAHNWDATNQPLQDEQGLTPLEGSNPGLGGGTRQLFEWTMLEWTPERGVFAGWIGQELLWREEVYGQIYAAYQQQKALLSQVHATPQLLADVHQATALLSKY